jgi:hypothetical protein
MRLFPHVFHPTLFVQKPHPHYFNNDSNSYFKTVLNPGFTPFSGKLPKTATTTAFLYHGPAAISEELGTSHPKDQAFTK